MVKDKRKLKRHRKRLQIKFGVEAASRFGFTEDLCDTGIFIKSASVQNPNSVLRLQLTTPDGEVIELTGRVMWAKKVPHNILRRIKGGMGIRILEFQSGADSYRKLCEELDTRSF